MSNNIIGQVEELFSDAEQWKAFLELIPEKDTIRNAWFSKLKASLNKCFAVENIVDEWGFHSALNDYRWFLKDYGKESLCLVMWGGAAAIEGFPSIIDFALWVDTEKFDAEAINTLLREKKYLPIISAFERLDFLLEDASDGYLIAEKSNFTFGDENDGNIPYDMLAWYANYKTQDFVSQVLCKVDRFRKDETITKLLRELNEKAQYGRGTA
jgi:hypothetical protein